MTINDLTITSADGGADAQVVYTDGIVSTTILLDNVASSLIDANDFLFA